MIPFAPTCFGGEEKALNRVAQTEFALPWAGHVRLVDHRQDSSADNVPLVVDRNRHHRLDVAGDAKAVVRADAEVDIGLDRHLDQRGDRVLQLLGKVVRARRGLLRRGRGGWADGLLRRQRHGEDDGTGEHQCQLMVHAISPSGNSEMQAQPRHCPKGQGSGTPKSLNLAAFSTSRQRGRSSRPL
jgi:hypothetical protein